MVSILLIFIFYKRPIKSLPNKDNVSLISSTFESGESKTISNKKTIIEIMTLLNRSYSYFHLAKGTSNDEPTNIDSYITIKLHVPT